MILNLWVTKQNNWKVYCLWGLKDIRMSYTYLREV